MTEQDSKKILRDFIYLDKDRMYSLYSQLFEGIADSMVESIHYSRNDSNKEKKLEATTIEGSEKIQNVVLFDHIYNTFEEKIKNRIRIINGKTMDNDIIPNSIIKITGYVVIEDYKHLAYLMRNFNDIGKAFATLKLKNNIESVSNNAVDKYAKDTGLYLNEKYTNSLVKIIENIHGDSMEITVELEDETFDMGFKALLDDQNMRLSSNKIRNLYGYKPCTKWTLVGMVTNIYNNCSVREEKNKSIFSEMFTKLAEVDDSFVKIDCSRNNIARVAPIAIYVEHE